MSSINYNNRTISTPQAGPNFVGQAEAFVDEFDQLINELLGKVCESTGQSQEDLMRELDEMDLSDSEEEEDGSDNDDDDTDDIDDSNFQGGKVTIEKTAEKEGNFILRALPVNSRPMFLLQRRVSPCYKGKENRESLRLCLPGKETLNKMMKV